MNTKLQHFSKMTNLYSAADIVDYNGVPGSEGAAMYDIAGTRNDGKRSGFGMFRDNAGNLIVCLDFTNQKSEYLAKEMFQIDAEYMDWRGAYKDERTIWNYPNICISKGFHTKARWEEQSKLVGYGFHFQKSFKKHIQGFFEGSDPSTDFSKDGKPVEFYFPTHNLDVIKVLREIERRGKINKPIIIWQAAQTKPKSFDLMAIITVALEVIDIASNFFPIPIPDQFFELAKKVVFHANKISEEGFQISDMDVALSLAEMVAPEATKGITGLAKEGQMQIDKIKNRVQKYSKYVEATRTLADGITTRQGMNFQVLKQAANDIGISSEEIRKLTNRYNLNKIETIDLRLAKDKVDAVNKKLRNASNMLTADVTRAKLKTGTLLNDLKEKNLESIPVMNDLFISGSSQSILRAIPGVEKLTSSIMKDQLKEKFNTSKDYKVNEAIAGMAAANFGIPFPSEAFETLVYDSLKYRAFIYKDKNIPFILPDSIGGSDKSIAADKKEELVKRLRNETGYNNIDSTHSTWDLAIGTLKKHRTAAWVGGGLAVFGAAYWANKSGKIKIG